ncbi:hypothetical protein B0H10DRAFT_2236001 [Mycena sp. CBHHK59/15]|nr:hypothetical protein B0H10DRAFT_2236001 [Mycena sp. CBHHK59/15]
MLGAPDFRHPYLRLCEGAACVTIWLICWDVEDVKSARFVECRRRRKDRRRKRGVQRCDGGELSLKVGRGGDPCASVGTRQTGCPFQAITYLCPEALIHLHFKLLGAWMLPSECHFCGVRHTENFGFRACGGWAGIAHVVVFYLRRLGWPVDEVAM